MTAVSRPRGGGPDGDASPFGVIPVQENEIVPPESLKAVKPQENYEGYTGNEGMTLERGTATAPSSCGPRAGHLYVLLQAGSRMPLRPCRSA